MKKTGILLLGVLALAILGACGKKDSADGEAKGGSNGVTANGEPKRLGKIDTPPPVKHDSVSAPSPDMAGEWLVEPSDRQRQIDATAIARGRKPQETTLDIQNGKYTLTVTSDTTKTVITGDAKQEGTKITLTATHAETTIDGKPILIKGKPMSRIPPPQTFVLQSDQLRMKDSNGLVYVRK